MSLKNIGLVDLCTRLGENPQATAETAKDLGYDVLTLPPYEAEPENSPVKLAKLGPLTFELDGEHLAEMSRYKAAGVVGVTQGHAPWKNTRVQLNALRYARGQNMPVHLMPLDAELGKGVAHDGEIAQRLGLETQPSAAETIALARDLQLVAETGVTAHIARLSSGESVRLIKRAKAEGLPITCDVAISHLLWDESYIEGYNYHYRLQPVLRSARDRQALIEALEEGVIDAVCSDHHPIAIADKRLPFAQSQPGAETLHLLRNGLQQLVDKGALSEQRAIDAVSRAPAEIIGL
ncbi:MAG: amidohydrolase family protein [Pseudomonadales bacterium]|jgi:dihydroorotase